MVISSCHVCLASSGAETRLVRAGLSVQRPRHFEYASQLRRTLSSHHRCMFKIDLEPEGIRALSSAMELPRYRISRQTVCRQCSSAKAKCSRGFVGASCGRCSKRKLACSLAHNGNRAKGISETVASQAGAQAVGTTPSYEGLPVNDVSGVLPVEPSTDLRSGDLMAVEFTPATDTTASKTDTSTLQSTNQRRPDFSNPDLVCSIDAEGIRNRWLNPYIPAPGQKAKAYDPTVAAFIHRMLHSYVSIVVHSRGIPPFVHPFQLEAERESGPLRTCLNVVRLFERSRDGDDATLAIVRREMDLILDNRHINSAVTALAAYQAYLTYSLTTYFFTNARDAIVQAMIQLQELASITAKQGIVCLAEQQNTRPNWEAWVLAEAKRRTLYVMYLFDGLLSARDGIPSFLGTELVELYAPACQALWSAGNAPEWEKGYNAFLAQWPEGYLTIDELWPTPEIFDDMAISRRRRRVDHWLEDVDRFGTMMYAVTSYIHKH